MADRSRGALPVGRRARWTLVLLLAVAVVLTGGCATVPSSGSVHNTGERGGAGVAALDRGYVPVLPPRPEKTFSPDDIVTGFREAMTDFTGDHAAARRFLTPELASTWDADARTVVYSSLASDSETLDPSNPLSPHVYTFDVTPVAVVDRDHGFHLADGTTRWRVTVSRQPSGVWRVSQVGPGTLLSQAEFNRAFRGLDIYYPAAGGGHALVPDHVYLPTSPESLPVAMVRQLVAGPTGWLAPSVRAVVDPRTQVRSVTVDADGDARVNLVGGALITASHAHTLLAALTWTLAHQLADVKAVTLSHDGVVIGGPVGEQDFPGVDPNAYPTGSHATYVEGDHVVQLTSPSQEAAPSAEEAPALPGIMDPIAPSASNGLAAIRRLSSGSEELVLYDGNQWRAVLTANHLTPPTWMPDGSSVWTVARLPGGRQELMAVDVTATDSGTTLRPSPVSLDLTGSGLSTLGQIIAVRLSRDGARVALILADHAGGQPYVARIEQRGGAPVVAGLRSLARPCSASTTTRCLANALDVAWSDADHIVVLGSNPQGDPTARTPYEMAVDGSSVQPVVAPGLPSNAVSISAAPGQPLAVVVPASDKNHEPTIYIDPAGTWTTAASGSGLHYPD